MSELTNILKLAFCFISDKVCTYAVEKLLDGDFTDQEFKSYVDRELDDIKFKLDANARKDLPTSIGCLRQGVQRLTMSLGKIESPSTPGFRVDRVGDDKKAQTTLNDGACKATELKSAEPSSTVEHAVVLANAIGKLKIASSELFQLAKESFKEAGREARRAFHNAALGTDERLLASKVRIASAILEHLDDPELAATDCLQYLEELHAMSSIQEIFSVYVNAEVKPVFKRELTPGVIESVTTINLMLADFITKFTTRRMAVFDWPVIQCGKTVINLIHYGKDRLPNLREMEITPPWDTVKIKADSVLVFAFNKNGDMICLTKKSDAHYVQKLDRTTCKLQPYCFSWEDSRIPGQHKISFCHEFGRDIVYILSFHVDFTLSVYRPDGKSTQHSTLKFLKKHTGDWVHLNIRVAVTNEGNFLIAIFSLIFKAIYICDDSGKLIGTFDPGLNDHSLNEVFATTNGEIVLATTKISDIWIKMVYIFSVDGQLQRSVNCRPRNSEEYFSELFYNPVTNKIISYVYYKNLEEDISIEYLSSDTGELERSYLLHRTDFPTGMYLVRFHPNGTLALFHRWQVVFLQHPSA